MDYDTRGDAGRQNISKTIRIIKKYHSVSNLHPLIVIQGYEAPIISSFMHNAACILTKPMPSVFISRLQTNTWPFFLTKRRLMDCPD